MSLPRETKTALAEEALSAFWQVIGQRFPQAGTGLGKRVFALQDATAQAIE